MPLCFLAKCRENGIGCSSDIIEAINTLEEAVEYDSTIAKRELGMLVQMGSNLGGL